MDAFRDGRLLDALEHATSTQDRVRALIGMGRLQQALAQADGLTDPLTRAMLLRAQGEPSRGRALLVDQDAGIEILLERSELARATGAPEVGTLFAGRALRAELHPNWTAQATLQLARCVADCGDLQHGLALADQALETFEDPHDERSVLLPEALDVAGALRRKLGQSALAVPMHRRAIDLWARATDEAPVCATSRYALAQALHRCGDFQGALIQMQQCFLDTVRGLGSEHLDTWITRFELGRLEVDCGEFFDGFPRMEAARAEVARRLGRQHPIVLAMDKRM